MPPHRFYPVRVRHEFTGEERDYFMFHLRGDFETEEIEAYWPAMKFYVFEKKGPFDQNPRRNIHSYPAGAATNRQAYVEIFRSYLGEHELDKIGRDFPYLVYREPYDLVWGKGWLAGMAMSEEMGNALLGEFGEDVIGHWTGTPIITGFDPDRDQIPEDLLRL